MLGLDLIQLGLLMLSSELVSLLLNIYVQLKKLENTIWGRHHKFAHLAPIPYSFSLAWFYFSRNIKIIVFSGSLEARMTNEM